MSGWLTGTLPGYSSVSGLEYIEADTGLSGGAAPQSVKLQLNQINAISSPRNLVEGGSFTVAPWQRGTAFTGITSTATYTADRFFAVGGASSSISVSRQAITAGSLPGFGYALQFGRAAANADTAAIKLGHVLETSKSIRVQGQPLCLSFYGIAGANFSAAGSALTVTVYGGTSTNDTAANMVAGSWSGQTTLYTGPVAITNTAWGTRFVVNNGNAGITVPATVTQLGFVFSYAPVGTAGANDWVQLAGIQLEAGIYPSLFEHLDAAFVLEQCQRFALQINEPAVGVLVAMGGVTVAANNQKYLIPLPVQMIKAPTVTVSAGSFKMAAGTTVAAATGLAAASTHTPQAISLVTTVTQTAGQASHLEGGGGSGYLLASADF